MPEITDILNKGIPARKTKDSLRDMELLRQFYIRKTGKKFPCSWCNRASLFRVCKQLV
jgi:hypothetical protein